ncbi:MAG: SPOR domain-containing protein [Roseiarcus sp.]
MSTSPRRLPEFDLEEFERRLRAAGAAQAQVEDPLAELTRLVNSISTEIPSEPPAKSPDAVEPEALDVEYALPAEPAPDELSLRPGLDPADAPDDAEAPSEVEPAAAPPPRASSERTTSWYIKVGGLVTAAVILVSGAIMLKFGNIASGPQTPPTILAAAGPTKVAPPSETAVQSPSDSGALLTKDSATGARAKIVDNQETPIDVASAEKQASPSPSQAESAQSPVAPTSDTPIIAPSATPAPPTAPAFAERKPVKTVTVRPDGTLIAVDSMPVAPPPAAAAPEPVAPPLPAPAPAPTVAAQPASPTLELPAPKTTKTTKRAVVARTDTTAPAAPINGPLQLGSAAAGDRTARLPAKLRPPASEAVANAAPAQSAGGYAVQLAAPRSEGDARNTIERLQSKYADALGNVGLGVHKGESSGEPIYRVRTNDMSKAEALALCQKVKADGGDCFVTRE